MARQLPVGTCLGHAVKSVRNNMRQAFRISWPWMLVLLAMSVIAFGAVSTVGDSYFGLAILAVLVWLVVAMLAGAAIAVHWHRYILLDEVPGVSQVLRVDNKTWRYFGNVLLIALLMGAIQGLVSLPISLAFKATSVGPIVDFVVSLVLTVVCGVLTYRLSVKLPAIALDRGDFRFTHAWEATRDNDLRLGLLFLAQFVVTIAILVVLYVLMVALMLVHAVLGIIGLSVFVVFLWLLGIFNITILTSLYGFFVENRDF
jgi:hypothetical protein